MGIDHAICSSGFHDGEVNGDFLALGEDGGDIARGCYLVHIGCDIGFVFGDAVGDGLDIPDEDAGIPEVVACLEVVLGGCEVGLFLEGADLADFTADGLGCFDIAITSLGTGRTDANGDDGWFVCREGEGVLDDALELNGVHHDGIGRGHGDIGCGVFLADAPAGPGDAGGGVACCGFGQDMVGGDVGELLLDDLYVGGISHNPEIAHGTDVLEAVHGELDEGTATAEDVDELLGVFGGAEGPEAAADAAGHDDYVSV